MGGPIRPLPMIFSREGVFHPEGWHAINCSGDPRAGSTSNRRPQLGGSHYPLSELTGSLFHSAPFPHIPYFLLLPLLPLGFSQFQETSSRKRRGKTKKQVHFDIHRQVNIYRCEWEEVSTKYPNQASECFVDFMLWAMPSSKRILQGGRVPMATLNNFKIKKII